MFLAGVIPIPIRPSRFHRWADQAIAFSQKVPVRKVRGPSVLAERKQRKGAPTPDGQPKAVTIGATAQVSTWLAHEMPKPKDWQAFQRNCVILFQAELGDPNAQEYGRGGQRQKGIDILGKRGGDPDHFVGVQCRRVRAPLKFDQILSDCEATLALKADLKEIIFATTASDDVNATDAAIAVEQTLRRRGQKLAVSLYGWQALQILIAKHDSARAAFFPWSPPARDNLPAEVLLEEILKRVPGLPLPVASSIVAAFGEDGEYKSSGEIEAILRAKATEYISLRDELVKISSDDPSVSTLREKALLTFKLGDFQSAHQFLIKARDIDREASSNAEVIARHRRASEAETLLAMARLSALQGHYQEATSWCLSTVRLLGGADTGLGADALMLSASYLKDEADNVGEEHAVENNIERLESAVIPWLTTASSTVRAHVTYQLAELHALHGYRTGRVPILAKAAKLLRELCAQPAADMPVELRQKALSRLGDTHVEVGLLRRSIRQAKLGLMIMEGAVNASSDFPNNLLANTYIRLGTAYANTGLLYDAVEMFRSSARAYERALDLLPPTELVDRANAHWGLGIALADLGERVGSTDLLMSAEIECDKALEEFTIDRYPIFWATVMTNRGNAKFARGCLEDRLFTLQAAVEDFKSALSIRTIQRFPLGFMKTAGNMGMAKARIAQRTANLQLAIEAQANLSTALAATVGAHEVYWTNHYEVQKAEITALIEALSTRAPSSGS